MTTPLETAMAELTDTQRKAVEWEGAPLLVLAGPGSGKTRVLTCRIARLLDSSRNQRFNVLGLTFTNKAANEMLNRVTSLVPGLEERAHINTFHTFCAQVLRQHGVHLGLKPNFAILPRLSDRQAILDDALRRDCMTFDTRILSQLLPMIDHLKKRLISPEMAEQHIRSTTPSLIEISQHIAEAYHLYEKELRRANALDFHSLIFEAHKLFSYPAMCRHYQKVYRYWVIDEFQDTNSVHYDLLRRIAGTDTRSLLVVVDDDQIVFEWNGTSPTRINELVKDFSCEILQLPTNFRCPPRIVDAANRLIVYNASRDLKKQSAVSVRQHGCPADGTSIKCQVFDTDEKEAAGIASEIAGLGSQVRDRTAVLARNRWLLDKMLSALKDEGVSAQITARRDDFVSSQMRWVVACLQQINRPLDRRNMAELIDTFNGFAHSALDWSDIESRSETNGVVYLTVWVDAVRRMKLEEPHAEAIEQIARLAGGSLKWSEAVTQILTHFESRDDGWADEDIGVDIKEDLRAWHRLSHEIKTARGSLTLGEFLQELQMRSKEPVPQAGSVRLMTIHGAKGLEFDTVCLIGLAEDILPSWQSIQKGDGSIAIEEERRGCFVAITRTRKQLILSRARRYRGWPKEPSRFLKEMGCLRHP